MPQTRNQVKMEACMESLEKGNERLLKEMEETRAFKESMQNSMDEIKRMMSTMMKEKGVVRSENVGENSTPGNNGFSILNPGQKVGFGLENIEEISSQQGSDGGGKKGETPFIPELKAYFGAAIGGAAAAGGVQGTVANEAYAAATRVNLPMFDVENSEAWISRAEQYFHLHGTPEVSKIDVALIAMEGDALHWYQWKRTTTPGLPYLYA